VPVHTHSQDLGCDQWQVPVDAREAEIHPSPRLHPHNVRYLRHIFPLRTRQTAYKSPQTVEEGSGGNLETKEQLEHRVVSVDAGWPHVTPL
jgi:hypothetical protein